MAPIIHHTATLALLAALAAAIVGTMQLITRERIAAERRDAEQRPLLALLPETPGAPLQLEARQSRADANVPGWEQPQRVFIAHRNGDPVAVILPAGAKGYGGPLRLLVGLDAAGRITGVQVAAHRETPGLGDRIATDHGEWLRQFQGESLQRTPDAGWAVASEQGEFDQLTGATITSRAAIAALKQALTYFAAHRAELLGDAEETVNER